MVKAAFLFMQFPCLTLVSLQNVKNILSLSCYNSDSPSPLLGCTILTPCQYLLILAIWKQLPISNIFMIAIAIFCYCCQAQIFIDMIKEFLQIFTILKTRQNFKICRLLKWENFPGSFQYVKIRNYIFGLVCKSNLQQYLSFFSDCLLTSSLVLN